MAFSGATTAVIHDAILNGAPIPLTQLNSQLPPKMEEMINKAQEKAANCATNTLQRSAQTGSV